MDYSSKEFSLADLKKKAIAEKNWEELERINKELKKLKEIKANLG